MESTRPIRALMRGLDALTVLNTRDGATVSEIAHEIRLPRTTVYRILETLCDGGFAFRDTTDDRYRLKLLARGLSDGFEDEAWIAHGAGPLIKDLCREVIWPVSIATLSGTVMMIRETTDHHTPLAIERYSAGTRVPLLTTAMGRTCLAFCSATQRDSLIATLARSNQEDDKLARGSRPELQRLLADIKVQGYATVSRVRRLLEEITLSVPVALTDRPPAALAMRFAAPAVPLSVALTRFLPQLRRCAAKISGAFLEHQAGARAGAPEAAA